MDHLSNQTSPSFLLSHEALGALNRNEQTAHIDVHTNAIRGRLGGIRLTLAPSEQEEIEVHIDRLCPKVDQF